MILTTEMKYEHTANKRNPFLFFLIAYLILFAVSLNNGFFWDTTHLASLQAWWYYDNNFKYFFLPTGIDSGHPSFFAMLLALMWKMFGVRVPVGHILMLPFIILMIREVTEICKYYFKSRFPYVAALVLFNPIILGQATLVSPDIVLFGFFFFTLNGILDNSKLKILIGALVLGAISMRGMMCVAYLCLFAVLRQGLSFKSIIRFALIFSPGILVVIAFLSLHYAHSGWIGYHANSPWADSFDSAGIKGFARNIVVFSFRMVDMGMVFIWIFMGIAIISRMKGSIALSKRTTELLLLWILCFLVSVLLQFFYRHSLLHRYLLPLIAITTFVFCSLAEEGLTLKQFKRVWLLSLVGLLSGNLWVFPDPIAKGWDATLAHLPYYKLRKEALHFIKAENIPLGKVNGGFPYNLTGKCIDLNSDTTTFSKLPPEQSPYVLYSNISNDYTDEQLNSFKKDWISLKVFGGWPVRFVLYKNPSL
ncbi:hypothetical protein [Agriterribacter sp.]|uniref:hypothetical protein n=1 Tax=Agriterribacter sp. TaxID=2821509 RepID=UPI002C86582B|nr:hypothetical protein [Agriterribacter sp.]HRO47784.1 hypothetical protein [Agriterribacter sp.]HRQ17983.1 hypothetical protein [Agriterribacter sp.]